MQKNIKLLIISCSTGSGHFRAAESIRLTCHKLYPDAQVLHIDMADYLDGIAHVYVVWFYNFFSVHIPGAYKFVYRITDNWLIQKLFGLFVPIIRLGSKKFIKRINDYQPDMVISTHFLPQLILSKKLAAPINVVITDYHAHRIWLAPKIKNFFVATDEMKNDLEKLPPYGGSSSAKAGGNIIVSGIPIHPDFLKEKNIDELKNQLGIENDWPIILIMPISSGRISAKEAVATIFSYHKNLNMVAISGKNNEKVFNDLKEFSTKNGGSLTVIKNVDNIDEWMRIADVIVSKAGGLTISEAVYLQKPMIIINPIPGQEDYNAAYLEKNHYCLRANSSDDLAKKIQAILLDPNLIAKKPHPALPAGRPDASEIILKKVFEDAL